MDAAQATVIAGGLGLAGTLIATAVAWRNANKAAVATAAAAAANKAATAANAVATASSNATQSVAAQTSAYEVAEYEAVTTLADTGEGEHIRTWKNLKVTQFIQDLKIPCSFSFSPGAAADLPVATALKGSALSARFAVTSRTATRIDGVVVIDGFATPDTGWVAFEVHQKFKGGFCLTQEEALETYKNDEFKQEYVSSSITVPSKRLVRSVVLPPSHRGRIAAPQAVVFIGDGELVDQADTTLAQSALNIVDNVASLVVQPPKVGKRYGISWMPPPRA